MIDFLRSSKAHLFVDALDETLHVSGDDFHHLSRVLRVQNSTRISAASQGSVREYLVNTITDEDIELAANTEVLEKDEPQVEIYAALFKVDLVEQGIQKSVEAGATRICVGESQYSSAKISTAKRDRIVHRWKAIGLNAAQQSRRATIPDIVLVDDIISAFTQGEINKVVCDPDGSIESLSSPIRLLIGPEGGLSDDEYRHVSTSARFVSLSPHVLRAETAMCVAAAMVAGG